MGVTQHISYHWASEDSLAELSWSLWTWEGLEYQEQHSKAWEKIAEKSEPDFFQDCTVRAKKQWVWSEAGMVQFGCLENHFPMMYVKQWNEGTEPGGICLWRISRIWLTKALNNLVWIWYLALLWAVLSNRAGSLVVLAQLLPHCCHLSTDRPR